VKLREEEEKGFSRTVSPALVNTWKVEELQEMNFVPSDEICRPSLE